MGSFPKAPKVSNISNSKAKTLRLASKRIPYSNYTQNLETLDQSQLSNKTLCQDVSIYVFNSFSHSNIYNYVEPHDRLQKLPKQKMHPDTDNQ